MSEKVEEPVDYEALFNKVEKALKEGFVRLSYNRAFGHFELGDFLRIVPSEVHGKTLLEVAKQLN